MVKDSPTGQMTFSFGGDATSLLEGLCRRASSNNVSQLSVGLTFIYIVPFSLGRDPTFAGLCHLKKSQ